MKANPIRRIALLLAAGLAGLSSCGPASEVGSLDGILTEKSLAKLNGKAAGQVAGKTKQSRLSRSALKSRKNFRRASGVIEVKAGETLDLTGARLSSRSGKLKGRIKISKSGLSFGLGRGTLDAYTFGPNEVADLSKGKLEKARRKFGRGKKAGKGIYFDPSYASERSLKRWLQARRESAAAASQSKSPADASQTPHETAVADAQRAKLAAKLRKNAAPDEPSRLSKILTGGADDATTKQPAATLGRKTRAQYEQAVARYRAAQQNERESEEEREEKIDRATAVLVLLGDARPRVRVEGIGAAAAMQLQAARAFLEDMIARGDIVAPQAARALPALGSARSSEKALLSALDAPLVDTRIAAAQSLGYLRCRKALRPLLALLGKRRSAKSKRQSPGRRYGSGSGTAHLALRATAARALGYLGKRSACKVLRRQLADPGEFKTVRVACAESLARLGDAKGWEFLRAAATGALTLSPLRSPLRFSVREDRSLQVLAVDALGSLGGAGAVVPLLTALESHADEVWLAAADMLLRVDPRLTHPHLRRLLRIDNAQLRARAGLVLMTWGVPDRLKLGLDLLAGPRPRLRAFAADALGRFGERSATPHLIRRLEDPSREVRLAAAEALGRLADPAARPALERLAAVQDDVLRATAVAGLANIAGRRKLFEEPAEDVRKFARAARAARVRGYRVESFLSRTPNGGPAVILASPTGERRLYKTGDEITDGFHIAEITLAPGKQKSENKPQARVTAVHKELGLSVELK